jgi:predicted ATPase
VAELNLVAGRKAAASAAYGAALTYFEAGVSLLAPSAWTGDYALALALHLGAGEAALMCPSPPASDYVTAALSGATSALDKIEAQDIRIKHHISRYETGPAIARTLEALRSCSAAGRPRSAPTRAPSSAASSASTQ